MGIKDVLQRMGQAGRERKEILKQMDQQIRMQKIIEDRQLSSNERELNQYEDEDREAMIKERLEFARKKRDYDIKFGHNPLNTKNITNHTEWEVLKEKNQFSNNKNMFVGQKSVLHSNRNLLRSNKKLMKGGNMFKI